jgi:hypothetical protein
MMFGLIKGLFRAIRYRRRWGKLAAIARTAADAATADLDRGPRIRRRHRRWPDERPPAERPVAPRVPLSPQG